jgi:hypothetical protein
MLWAGSAPYDIVARDGEETEDYEEITLEIALWRDGEWLLKQVKKLRPTKENALPLLSGACHEKTEEHNATNRSRIS